MKQRITHNTATLQKQFPGVYRDFFARSQRAASASGSFLWSGEFAGFYGGLTVSQKLPIRSYVGLETTFDGLVQVEREYQAFNGGQQRFVTVTADDSLCTSIKQYLTGHYANDKKFTGVRVHLLTEVPLGHSLGMNGAIAAALALLITKDQTFDAVFKTAHDILARNQAGRSSGVTTYMALADCTEPLVFMAQGERYLAKPISELAKVDRLPSWPIDFGLIYTGTQTNAENVILANTQTVQELEAGTARLSELFDGQLPVNFNRAYLDALTMTSSLLITALVDIYQKGSDNPTLERLFRSMNQYQNLLHILNVSNGSTDLLYTKIHALANKQVNDVGSGVKISGIGKGGVVLFAVPYGSHRSGLLGLVDSLRKDSGRALWLDYASWLDGVGGEPGVIEQDITKGKRSHFIDRDSFLLTILEKGLLRKQVLTNEHFANFTKGIDLLLDVTTGKITIAGLPMSSKELSSQKATVSILAELIRTKKFNLKNTALPSSYGQNRYDLQGKIVLPLVKQVKAITDRDLQLTIKGKMYEDFELSLNPSNVVIAIVDSKV